MQSDKFTACVLLLARLLTEVGSVTWLINLLLMPCFDGLQDGQWQLVVMAFLTALAAFRLPWLGEALHGRIGLERQLQMLQARALTIEEFNALCSILLEPGAD